MSGPKLTRRALLGSHLAIPALAQPAWPDRPIRLVVPFAQGGPMDLIARLLGEHLRPALALQLPFPFEVTALRYGLMGSSP